MNPALQQELAAWLSKLRDSADVAGNFAIEQAPLIVQERVLYGRITETSIFVALLVVVGFAAWCIQALILSKEVDEGVSVIGVLLSIFGGAFAAITAAEYFSRTMQVWFAPRIYVIEWLASLL